MTLKIYYILKYFFLITYFLSEDVTTILPNVEWFGWFIIADLAYQLAQIYIAYFESFLLIALCYLDLSLWQFNIFTCSACYLFICSCIEMVASCFDAMLIFLNLNDVSTVVYVDNNGPNPFLMNTTLNTEGCFEIDDSSKEVVNKELKLNHGTSPYKQMASLFFVYSIFYVANSQG